MKKMLFALVATLTLAACSKPHEPQGEYDKPVTMTPDYRGVTFPATIAAPSFVLEAEGAEDFQVQLWLDGNKPSVWADADDKGGVTLPLKQWRKLLAEAKGGDVAVRIMVKRDGRWLAHPTSGFHVSADPIDGYLVYRLLYPGYELWSAMGIYQRDLGNYEQKPILENKDFGQQCVNCHNFSANDPERGMMVHVRGKQGGTLISRQGKVEKISSRFMGAKHGATYPGWSRDGRFIAFSANDVGQVFHSSGSKPIEVVDREADLMVYDVENHRAYAAPQIQGEEWVETFPNWSPDGRTIYFCRARGYDEQTAHLDSIRYALCAIDFNPADGTFGEVRTLYDAPADGASVSFPRCSPDGRWLMFTRSDYGNFSIWHEESQLCVMDLETWGWRDMDEVNSGSIDSYHSWDSSGRWFVFSSKRLDGLWARPFIAAFDPATGRASRPFCLPQKQPEFYTDFMRTFNIPELISAPVTNPDALLHGIASQEPQAVELGIGNR